MDLASAPGIRGANLAVKFLLELCAFAALAYWGTTVGSGVVPVVLAIAAPLTAIVLWGLFAAPRAEYRLPIAQRIPLELGVFAAAAIALIGAGGVALGIAFAAVAVVNSVLLTVFKQWEQ